MTNKYLSGRCGNLGKVLDRGNPLLKGYEDVLGDRWFVGAGKPADSILGVAVGAS